MNPVQEDDSLNPFSSPLNAPVIGKDGRGVYNGGITEEGCTMQCDIGANIRRLRLARSMTQEQLAQRLNLTA